MFYRLLYKAMLKRVKNHLGAYEKGRKIMRREHIENEKTVRNYKNTLVRDLAVFLFGSDAI